MSFALRSPAHQFRRALADAPVVQSFAEKHKPRALNQLCGNLPIVDRLQKFVANPYPTAFVFCGNTGVGKTCAAEALANDLGCREYSGLHVIDSACQDVETVKRVIRSCSYSACFLQGASGWHTVIVNEADTGSAAARALWLSFLDDLPPRTVVAFTTNRPETLGQRFLDRTQRIDFPSKVKEAIDSLQALSDQVWFEETGAEDGPEVQSLPNVVIDGHVNFRWLVFALEARIRYGA